MSIGTIAIYIAAMLSAAIALNLAGWWSVVRLLDRLGLKLDFERFVGVRHLRGRKSGFLTAIGILSILGVSFSSCTLTTVLSVMGGFSNDLKVKILETNAHVVVDSYGSDIDGWRKLIEQVSKVEGVKAAAPIVQGEMMINARTNNHAILLKGIDPKSFKSVSRVLGNLEEGEIGYIDDPQKLFDDVSLRRAQLYGSIGDKSDDGGPSDTDAATPRKRVLPAIIVGRELSKALRLYIGEEVNIVSPLGGIGPTGPIPKSRPFRVGGVFFSGMYEFDSLYAYTALNDAQKFLNKGDRISEIHISVADPDDSEAVARRIGGAIGGRWRVRSWAELNASLFSALKLEKIVMFIFLSMAILVASFCILATLTMLVLEKGSEISILLTLGASQAEVRKIFRFEGLLIGLVGTASGLLVGFGLCTTLQHVGLPIDPEVWYIDKLPVKMELVEFFLVGLASMIITQVATLYPTYAAAKLTPVEGLKNDR